MKNLIIFFLFLIFLVWFSTSQPVFAFTKTPASSNHSFISSIGDGFGNFFHTIGNFFSNSTKGEVPEKNNTASYISEIPKSYLANMFTLMDKKIKAVEKMKAQTTTLSPILASQVVDYAPVGASILPTTTTYNLGSPDTPWSTMYVNNLYLPGTSSVGIGTTTPVAALDVNGNIVLQANGNFDVRGAGNLTIGGTTQTGLTVGRSGAQTTINGSSLVFNPTSWTATPTISGLITANGGLTIASGQTFNLSGFGSTANSMLYANNSGAVSQVGTGTSGYCLVSGTSVPFWQTCPTGAGLWTLSGGALYTTDTNNDLLLGGTSTASATFGFINVGSGTPTATVGGNFVLKVPSGNNKNIQLGVLNGGALKFQTSAGGDEVLSTRLYIGSNGQVGINTTSPTTNLDINGNASASSSLSFNASSTNDTLNLLNGSNLKIQTSPGGSGLNTRLYIDNGGNIGIGNSSPASLLSIGSGSPFQVTSGGAIGAATGFNSSGAITFSQFSANGGLLLTNASGLLSQTTVGSLGQCLLSNGGGTPAWGSCSSGGATWQENNGVLSPANITDDLLLGGTSTVSATFGFLNVASGIPTASISGNFALKVPSGNNSTIVQGVLNGGAIKFQTSPGGDSGLATRLYIANGGNVGVNTILPSTNFDVAGNASISGSLMFDKGSADAQIGILNGFGMKFQTSQGGDTGLATRLYIQNNGNVGINTITPSAKLDVSGTASISGQLALYGTPTIQSTANQTLMLGGNTTGNIILQPLNGIGSVGIGTVSPLSAFDVRGSSGTLSVASISGNTSFATLIANNNSSSGDIFSASSSSIPVFTVAHNGDITDSGATNVNFSGANITVASCTGCGSVTNFWALNSGFLSPTSGGTAISIGQTIGLTGAGLSVKLNSLGNAAAYVENSGGAGDLFTASSAGSTKFRLTNNGSSLFQGDMISSIGNGASANGSNALINNINDQGSLIPNAGFESIISSSIADGWFPAATASAGVFSRDTTSVIQGNASLKINQSVTEVDAIYSSCIPLTGDSHAAYNLNWFDFGASGTVPTIGGWIDWYTNKANCQSDTSVTIGANPAQVNQQGSTGSWQRHGSGATVLSNSNGKTWARVHFEISCSSAPCVSNLDGIRLTEKDGGQGLDYAENYPADPKNIPQPGDVVSLASIQAIAQVSPANKYMDQATIGVVSTNPGYILDDGSVPSPKVPIALAGRIPVNVSTKNGAIHVGDYLTSSNIPGVATKAITPGTVIGKALEEYTSSDASHIGKIEVFVNVSYADPTTHVVLTNTGDLAVNGLPITTISASAQTQNMTTSSTPPTGISPNEFIQLQNQVASFSAQLTNVDDLSQKVTNLEKSLPLFSSSSTGSLTNGDATISGQLSVTGKTLLSTVGITGNVTMGLLSIDGLNTDEATTAATINTTAGPLKLQSMAINGIDFLNGKVTMDTSGNIVTGGDITVKVINADKLHLKDTGDDAVVGTAVIPAGEKSIVINTNSLTNASHIFVTADTMPVAVAKKKISDNSFDINIANPLSQDLTIEWWVVN